MFMSSFFEAIFLPFIKQVSFRAPQIDNLRTAISLCKEQEHHYGTTKWILTNWYQFWSALNRNSNTPAEQMLILNYSEGPLYHKNYSSLMKYLGLYSLFSGPPHLWWHTASPGLALHWPGLFSLSPQTSCTPAQTTVSEKQQLLLHTPLTIIVAHHEVIRESSYSACPALN